MSRPTSPQTTKKKGSKHKTKLQLELQALDSPLVQLQEESLLLDSQDLVLQQDQQQLLHRLQWAMLQLDLYLHSFNPQQQQVQ